MNASARPVAVIGPDSPIGLTVVRELDEHGLRVLALGKSADSLARASRHATIFETIDGPLAEYLPKVVARHDPLAVLAISEHHLIALASLKGKLGDTKVLCPDPDKLAVVLDKRQTLEIAQGLGIEVPQSWQPLADEDRKSKAANLAYPVAIKWADPAEVSAPLEALGLPLEKVEYAASSEALIAILSRYDVLGLYPMVQEWCPGEGLGQMLNMQDGSATLTFQHRRLREWPPTGGVSSFCEAIDPAQVRGRHRLDISQYTWCKTMLEGQILTWGGDRMDMANSMEARPAFLDHHVAEYAVQIPPEVRIRDGIEKWVLREAMVNVLPKELYERKKFAFMAPPAHTDPEKRAAVQEMLDHWITDDRVDQLGLFDRGAIDQFVQAAWRETDGTQARRNDIVMNHLLQLHILQGQYVESMPLPVVD